MSNEKLELYQYFRSYRLLPVYTPFSKYDVVQLLTDEFLPFAKKRVKQRNEGAWGGCFSPLNFTF